MLSMLSKILDLVLGYLKGKSYWKIIEPFVTLVVLYFLTLIFAYQYIEWSVVLPAQTRLPNSV